MKRVIKEMTIKTDVLRLIMNHEIPLVEWDHQFFNHIWLLGKKFHLLSDLLFIREFSEISNFLWKGLEFIFIDHIAAYQQKYWDQIEWEKKNPSDLLPYRLTDYKIFDVAVMHDPLIEEGVLKYFVQNTRTGLPYQVVCPFPYLSASTLVHYQILPMLN